MTLFDSTPVIPRLFRGLPEENLASTLLQCSAGERLERRKL